MDNRDDIERSYAFGDLAFSQIKGRGLAAIPRNYDVWYCYASGYHAELSDAVNAVLSQNGSISQEHLDTIFENYLSQTRSAKRSTRSAAACSTRSSMS